ncbi:MAG: DcaP family trimeric outer membrane transporter [Bacteroidales bacterium]
MLQGAALLLSMGLSPLLAQAQEITVEDNAPNSVVYISTDKAGDEIIRIINETQSPRFHDPSAPRFLLTDRKGTFALGIGGYVKGVAEYDFNGISDNIDFYPSQIPTNGQTYARNQFQMDVTTSTVFLKLVGRTKLLGDIVVYTAGNFRGSGKAFELRNAYASFLGFTVGYDYGSFMDLAAIPPSIDFAGPSGMTIYHAAQIRYEHSFLNKKMKFGVGVEMPSVDGLTNEFTTINVQRMPDIPIYLQYGWNSQSHIRLGGIIRNMTYNNLKSQKAVSEAGWGAQLSTTFNLGKKFVVYGQGTYGRGIAQFMNDISMLNVDLVPISGREGEMEVLPMMGWYAGLQYNICPNLFVSSSYSQSRLYGKDGYPCCQTMDQYRKGNYLVANIFWNVSKNLQIGAEYIRGWRTDFNDQQRTANRVNASAQYSF